MAVADRQPRLLLIDDQAIVAEMVQAMLHDQPDILFSYVPDAAQALDAAVELEPTVVLIDLRMPGIDGFGIIRQFRADARTAQIPMILLSSEESPELKVKGFAEGANDYLIKWPDKLELVARVRYHSSAYSAHKQRDDAFRSLHRSQQELLERTRELAASQAALHHAQKIEAVGKLTGGVAHDFNNVLQIISGNLHLLELELQDNAAAQRRIAAALEGVERGASLASQLLAFARRQPLQPLVINIGSLVQNMDALLRRALGERTHLETVIANDLWNTLVDPNQLENVILNLAINARDAMDGEGRLLIQAVNFVLDDGGVGGFPDLDAGEYVLLSVSDSGAGMPPEVMERAFEPFFTTKMEGKGTGLGLSMAYGVVKQSGGHIAIDSRVGRGTTVKVFLPRVHEPVAELPEPQAGPLSGGVETILVVEDEAEVRAATVEILSKLGYKTLQAEDGLSGLRMIESGAPIDLLFSDVVMPGPVRSDELAKRAKELMPGIEVLFASGYADSGIVQGGKLDPGVNLLSKPYTAEGLARKIRHMLRKRRRKDAA